MGNSPNNQQEDVSSEKGWVVLRIVVIAAVFSVLLIALLSATPRLGSKPSHAGGTIWVTALSAIGTLGAVWAALQAVRDTSARTRRIQSEAAAREDTLRSEANERETRLRREALEREDTIRRGAEEREERARHDTIRPVASVEGVWEQTDPATADARGGRLVLQLIHEAGQTGFDPYIVLAPPEPGYEITLGFRGVLRPRLSSGFTAQRETESDKSCLTYAAVSEEFISGSTWYVICRMQDALGWWWEQRSLAVTLYKWPLEITMSMPEHVEGPQIQGVM